MSNNPKIKLLRNVVDSLVNIEGYLNPLDGHSFSEKILIEINLLSGEFKDGPRTDTIGDIYFRKHQWFIQRMKELKMLDWIKSATIDVKFGVEKVRIKTVEGKVFEKELNYKVDYI